MSHASSATMGLSNETSTKAPLRAKLPQPIQEKVRGSSADMEREYEEIEIPALRAEILTRIMPSNLVPMATANGMLIMGSQTSDDDCFFPLPRYLIWTGTISLSLIVVGTVGRYVVRWILEDRRIRSGDHVLIKILEYLGIALLATQVLTLFVGSLITFPRLPYVQWKHANLPNYCDLGITLFASVYLLLAWCILFLALFSALFIFCYASKQGKPPDYLASSEKNFFIEV